LAAAAVRSADWLQKRHGRPAGKRSKKQLSGGGGRK